MQLYVGPCAEIAEAIIPYSPDLAPSNFLLFPKMKEHLAGKRLANDEGLKDAVVTWFNNQAATWYEKGIPTNWCQDTTSALMSKATKWKGR